MAELTFKSPGISTREIDLSGPTSIPPQGIPAGVIGTARKGKAFVPITIATFTDFMAEYGPTHKDMFGTLAMYEWMVTAKAGTYLRVLGVGDGNKRLTSAGSDSNSETVPIGGVKNAGFIVGSQQVKANGYIGHNKYAYTGGVRGRSFFLGAFMSESAGSSYFTDAGLEHGGLSGSGADGSSNVGSIPIIHGILMTPSGVLPALSGNYQFASTASVLAESSYVAGHDGGFAVGAVNIENIKDYTFVMLLNGHKNSQTYSNTLTASFSPKSSNYFPKVLNTDPNKIEEAGHYLYTWWTVEPKFAAVTGSYYVLSASMTAKNGTGAWQECGFLLSSSLGRNAGSTTIPNFENFSDRFTTANAPWVISQKFGGAVKNLFRIHSLDDGASGNTTYKVSIRNVQKSSVNDSYGTFDLVVRAYGDTDVKPEVLQSHLGLDLNPGSDNYIARRIGDMNHYFDFNKSAASQKLVVDGTHRNLSVYCRVEMNSEITNGAMEKTALPCGFRGPSHLVTSGSSIMQTYAYPMAGTIAGDKAGGVIGDGSGGPIAWANQLVEMPTPMRHGVWEGPVSKRTANSNFHWGLQFTIQNDLNEPNSSTVTAPTGDPNWLLLDGYGKYFPNFATGQRAASVGDNAGAANISGTVLDSDKFNNNIFSLERIQILTQSSTDITDSTQWQAAAYRRAGILSASLRDKAGVFHSGRFLNVDKDFGQTASKKYRQFTFIVQGGFDGVNVFNEDKQKLTNNACKREMDDSAQGAVDGPTVATYLKALDVMAEKSDVDIQILAIPGIRDEKVTNHALDKTEERFDAIYLMDVEERDVENNVVTSSLEQTIGINNTVDNFKSRNLDSSFGAAYFPDCHMKDPMDVKSTIRVPPSVSVIGAFAYNDKVAHPWFAPAGFTRGVMKDVIDTQIPNMLRIYLDALYDADINPIAMAQLKGTGNNGGAAILGQKTLLAAASALDRVNVRRLLIDIRRKVKTVADSFLFEPNRESTLARFSAQVNPILQRIQQQQGLDKFKVIIDTTTTTQADIENNTIRGKIFLQPTRAIEFISLDFVVTNNGTEI